MTSRPGTWKERRRYPRFKVASLDFLRSSMDKRRSQEQAVTVSLGGCGFFGPAFRGWPLSPVQRIFPSFEILGDKKLGPFELQANIIYMKPVKIHELDLIFYGVEFLPSFQEKIRPLISELEALSQQGLVKISD
jgi:hypothetical protein